MSRLIKSQLIIKYLLTILFVQLTLTNQPSTIFAQSSDHYSLHNYGFGAGGVVGASGVTNSMMGIAGQVGNNQLQGEHYQANGGLQYTNQASVPGKPTFTNPASTYDRLKFLIDDGGNPTDSTFAIAITDDNWITTKYIQNDFTIGNSLGAEDWQTASVWNGTGGNYLTQLKADTTYQIKVKARSGDFTETMWSEADDASTVSPSLTFSVSGDSVTFEELTATNNFTDTTKSTTITTSTNAYYGYVVYGHETQPLTDWNGHTIIDYPSPNGSPTTWSEYGFGYTTSDSTLVGGDSDRFTNGGPKYAGFTTTVPGDPVADHTGPIIETPINNEAVTIQYRVTAPNTTHAGSYSNQVIYVVVPEY